MSMQTSDLENYFKSNNKRLIQKWNHYFDIYERHFEKFRNNEVVILEIGISQGGSLQMWKDYFGDKVKIYGIDVDSRCKEFEEENIEIFIGSQSSRKFLRKVKQAIPKVDILIDDGGHTMMQQKVTFEEMFSHVKDNGVYLCEDIHTSYWSAYGGGYKRLGTFIQYSKSFIDKLNAYHSREFYYKADSFTKSVNSLHYYDSVLVIEKKLREKPIVETTGNPTFMKMNSLADTSKTSKEKIFGAILKVVSLLLGLFKLPGVK